jgi:hypothetical protein
MENHDHSHTTGYWFAEDVNRDGVLWGHDWVCQEALCLHWRVWHFGGICSILYDTDLNVMILRIRALQSTFV